MSEKRNEYNSRWAALSTDDGNNILDVESEATFTGAQDTRQIFPQHATGNVGGSSAFSQNDYSITGSTIGSQAMSLLPLQHAGTTTSVQQNQPIPNVSLYNNISQASALQYQQQQEQLMLHSYPIQRNENTSDRSDVPQGQSLIFDNSVFQQTMMANKDLMKLMLNKLGSPDIGNIASAADTGGNNQTSTDTASPADSTLEHNIVSSSGPSSSSSSFFDGSNISVNWGVRQAANAPSTSDSIESNGQGNSSIDGSSNKRVATGQQFQSSFSFTAPATQMVSQALSAVQQIPTNASLGIASKQSHNWPRNLLPANAVSPSLIGTGIPPSQNPGDKAIMKEGSVYSYSSNNDGGNHSRMVAGIQSTNSARESAIRQKHQKTPSSRHSMKWQQRYEELLQFKAIHNHCNVPNEYSTNPELGRWVKRQRHQYWIKRQQEQHGSTRGAGASSKRPSSMTKDREIALEQIGFIWGSHNDAWEKQFNNLKLFKLKHGHCKVPSSYPDDRQLAIWAKRQRREFKLFCDEMQQQEEQTAGSMESRTTPSSATQSNGSGPNANTSSSATRFIRLASIGFVFDNRGSSEADTNFDSIGNRSAMEILSQYKNQLRDH